MPKPDPDTSDPETPAPDRSAIVWFRRDLRLSDHDALFAAVRSGRPVVPLFILETDPPVRATGAASLWWLDKSLRALAKDIEDRGSRLILRKGPAEKVLREVISQVEAGMVAWCRTYEPGLDARDAALAESLREDGLEVEVCGGRLLIDPAEVKTKAGGAYGVFTPFWRVARTQVPDDREHLAPQDLKAPKHWPQSEALNAWGLHPTKPDWSKGFEPWRPGEAGAKVRLRHLLSKALNTYPRDRDRPAVDGTSRLSPHLAWGEISPRHLHRAVQTHAAAHHLEGQGDKFLTELGWREFDYGLLAQDGKLHEQPFKPALSGIKWRRATKELEAWKRGRTGYPIVDAGMRQLWTRGWMHNRVRLITASFLVKHLLIDWREGEAWFWDCLVDADPANNPANWQWSAGTGADAQPFFRIFNPMTQGEKFDPQGEYVKRWVPELAKLDAKYIHAPWTAPDDALEAAKVVLGETYPRPIVEHEAARKRALDALSAARKG